MTKQTHPVRSKLISSGILNLTPTRSKVWAKHPTSSTEGYTTFRVPLATLLEETQSRIAATSNSDGMLNCTDRTMINCRANCSPIRLFAKSSNRIKRS